MAGFSWVSAREQGKRSVSQMSEVAAPQKLAVPTRVAVVRQSESLGSQSP